MVADVFFCGSFVPAYLFRILNANIIITLNSIIWSWNVEENREIYRRATVWV